MKKMIATLAIAGLGAALATGAQAQTISGSSGSATYSATFALASAPFTAAPAPGFYTYTYSVTAVSGTLPVSEVTFNGVPGFLGGNASTGFGGSTSASTAASGLSTITFSGGTLTTASKFSFLDLLPPTAVVTLGGTPNVSGSTGVNTSITGPGSPAVPEAGSFALLGLGLLPLAFVARRRIASQS